MTYQEAKLIRSKLETAAQHIPEIEAYDVVWMYPKWAEDGVYAIGKTVEYNRKLYKCRQAHTAQSDFTPDKTPALWELIPPPGEEGTHDNPYQYAPGMALLEGKYYTELDVLYICTRDTGVPVYQALADLVGLYVEVAE